MFIKQTHHLEEKFCNLIVYIKKFIILYTRITNTLTQHEIITNTPHTKQVIIKYTSILFTALQWKPN